MAGTSDGNAGNGGNAQNAELSHPTAVTTAPGGGFVVADTSNAAVRRVTDIGAVPPAVLRRSLFVEPAGGSVNRAARRAWPRGLPLKEEDIVPNGSKVDAHHRRAAAVRGARRLELPDRGRRLRRRLHDAPAHRRPAAYTEFSLGKLSGCPTGAGRGRRRLGRRPPAPRRRAAAFRPLAHAAKKKKKRRKKRLWVSDRGGRWRTATGSGSAGLDRDEVADLAALRRHLDHRPQGRVRVFDKIRKRTRILRAGQTYLALNKKR